MSDLESKKADEISELLSPWGTPLHAAVCPYCDWSYLLPPAAGTPHCPHCFRGPLTPLAEDVAGLPALRPPEQVLPFSLAPGALAAQVERFAGGIPFPPSDLTAENLRKRMYALYLPVWLVDVEVTAVWQGEAGFDYEVVSHQDRYDDNRGGWSSHEVKERRVRWEPRVGRMARAYANIMAPALEEDATLRRNLGPYDLEGVQPYAPALIAKTLVRLPNRSPEDAWPDAIPAVQAAAQEACQLAAGADHVRAFRWTPDYAGHNWTLLLLPAYATYYLDDAQQPQPVLIHGQIGTLSGARRASMQRAQRTAVIVGVIAVVIALVSLLLLLGGFALPPLLVLGGIGLLVAMGLGVGAFIPLLMVWRFNRDQGQTQIQNRRSDG